MTTTLPAPAQAWLDRLESLAGALPPERAAELVADLREHLAAALPPDADAARVAEVLDDLGSPEAVVAEAASDLPAAPAPVTPPLQRRGTAEVVALVLLVVWPLLLVLLPVGVVALVVALALVWTSQWWNLVDKIVGTVVGLLPVGLAVAGLLAWRTVGSEPVVTSGTGQEPGPLGPEVSVGFAVPILLAVIVLLVIAGVAWLAVRLRKALSAS